MEIFCNILMIKISIYNKCCSFEVNNPEKKNNHTLHKTVNVLEQQIIQLEWFLKDHVTLKTGVMMLSIQLCNYF